MKAIILAAGKGTRMRDLTNEVPKPMLKVQGKPILDHIVAGVLSAGIRDIFIVTGFRAEVIESYFEDGSKWGANIAYGRQIIQDGTGKAPELAKDFIGGSSFLLTYGDILVKPETYTQMLERYHGGAFSGVITVTAGIYIFKPTLFDYTARLQKSPRGEYELTDAIIRMLEAGYKFAGLEVPGRWVDVRDPEVLASLEKETT